MNTQPVKDPLGNVTLLGTPAFRARAGGLARLPAKAFYLIAYLVLSADDYQASRAQLARFLWANVDPRTASANLRQLLARLRAAQQAIGIAIVGDTPTHVHLRLDSADIDLIELKSLLKSVAWPTLPRLSELFAHDLIEFHGAAEEDLQSWVVEQREKLRNHFIAAVMAFIGSADTAAHAIDAKAICTRVLELDPYHEAACRELMRIYAAEGQVWEAVRVFDRCRQLLHEDLGVGPEPETAELMARIRGGKPAMPAPGSGLILPAQPRVTLAERPPGEALVQPLTAATAGTPKVALLMPSPPTGGPGELFDVTTSLLEDVILSLCSQRTIQVVAPHTSWHLNEEPDLAASAGRYGISHLVETSINTLHGSNYLSLKLLDARSRIILWAGRVPLGNLDVAASYREICVGIVLALIDSIERAELRRYEGARDRTAYYWYLVGQRSLRHVDLPNIRKARRAFRMSIDAFEGFAPAYSGIARTMQMEWLLLARGDAAPLVKSESLARRAIELDPRDSSGYRMLAFSALYGRRFDESVAHLTEAERRHPQHADLLAEFADTLAHSGNPAGGLKKIDRAIELNPIVPDMYWWWAAGMHYQLHRYQEAVNCALKMKDQRPAMRLLAASYAQLGEKSMARGYVNKTLEVYPDFRVEHWLSIVPNRNADDTRHYMDGLRSAGFA